MGRTLGAGVGATVLNQDIYELSDVQKHRLGTRVQRGDCVYRYAKAIQTYTRNNMLAHSYYHQHIMYATIAVASPIGSNLVYVTVGAGDGALNDGAFAAHDLEGGTICVQSADDTGRYTFSIRDNNAAVSGGTMTVTIDGELPVATVATTWHVDAIASPYLVSCTNTQDRYCFMGLPMRIATTTLPYHWLQTWGPAGPISQPLVGVSSPSAPVVTVVARHDGTLDVPVTGSVCLYAQRVGYVMSVAQDGTQGLPFVFLQIAP